MNVHLEVQSKLDAVFVGDPIEARAMLKVREHMCGCSSCASYFDELVALERALAEEEDDAEARADSFERRYTDAVVAGRTYAAPPPRRSWLASLRGLLSGHNAAYGLLAAAAAVALVWVGVTVGQDDVEPVTDNAGGQFQARGGAVDTIDHGLRRFEIFCVQKPAGGEAGVRFVEADPATRQLTCGLDDDLKFAYLSVSASGSRGVALPHVTFVGVDEDGSVRFYLPHAATDEANVSTQVEEAPRLRPLGETIRLSVNHAPGQVRIYGIFSAAPIHRADLAAHLEGVKPEALSSTLDLDGMPRRMSDTKRTAGAFGVGLRGAYVVTSRVLRVEGSK